MRDKPKDYLKQLPRRLQEWLKATNVRTKPAFQKVAHSLKQRASSLRRRIPKKFRELDFDVKNIDFKKIVEHRGWFRWALLVIGVYLASEVASRMVGLFIRPVYPPIPKKMVSAAPSTSPDEDYDAILRRNMFNVEGKIPDPFDQGLLDCMSQARPSTQRISLLGTIVMGDDRLSVALIQDESNPVKIAVKKDELFFDGKFQAMKVERKKLCFQVKSTQDLEYIEIPDDTAGLGITPALQSSSEGVTPLSETQFTVKKTFLDEKLANLNDILQTARAVPYVEGGRFKGFLIQTIDPGSPFAQLGIRQGDILTSVNDIVLDNAGKGLEAFQRLKDSSHVSLDVLRGGQKTTLSFDLK